MTLIHIYRVTGLVRPKTKEHILLDNKSRGDGL